MICISTRIEENWGQWSLMLSNNFFLMLFINEMVRQVH